MNQRGVRFFGPPGIYIYILYIITIYMNPSYESLMIRQINDAMLQFNLYKYLTKTP